MPDDGLDRHTLGPIQPADLRPIFQTDHPPSVVGEGQDSATTRGQYSRVVDTERWMVILDSGVVLIPRVLLPIAAQVLVG